MDELTKFQKYLNIAIDWIWRNLVLVIISGICILILQPGIEEIRTFLIIIIVEALAITLSGLALFAYTKINFIKLLMEGSDGEMNSVERHSVLAVLGQIFLGVHILTGLTILGIYIALFNK